MRGWPGKTCPKTPTKLSSSIFQRNFFRWLRKNFTVRSKKSRCVIIWTSKWYILIVNQSRNGHITVIFKKFKPVPYLDFSVWFHQTIPWNQDMVRLLKDYKTMSAIHHILWSITNYYHSETIGLIKFNMFCMKLLISWTTLADKQWFSTEEI